MQPTPYTPTVDFADEEADGVSGRSTIRTAALDTELANIATTASAIITNLAIIQRDDGGLRDGIVSAASLSAEVAAMIVTETVRGQWATATAYAIGDVVSETGTAYLCTVAHTSGTFATDLAANKWGALGSVVSNIAIVDGSFSILGSSDASKIAKFEVDGLTTATTRTYTLPDRSSTIATLDGDQTFTGSITLGDTGGADTFRINAKTITIGNDNITATRAMGTLTTSALTNTSAEKLVVTATTSTGASTRNVIAKLASFTLTASVDYAGTVFGASETMTVSGTANIATLYAQYQPVIFTGTAGGGEIYGYYTYFSVDGGAVTEWAGYKTEIPTIGAGTIDAAFGYECGDLGPSAGVTTAVSFKASEISFGTTRIAFKGELSAASGKFNAYFDGTAQNYLNGITRIGAGATSSLTSGRLQVFEASDSNVDLFRYAADATGVQTRFFKSRNATINTHTVVQSGDALMTLTAYGSDGTAFQTAGRITVEVDGTPGGTDMPGRIVFSTTPDGSGTLVEAARITNAGAFLAAKRVEEKQGASVNSANSLTLGADGNYFQINNATQINLLDNTNWQGGSEVTLKFNSTPTVKHNQAASTTFRPILLAGAADFVASANDTLTLRYDSTDQSWYETSRAVI